jgi:hypothetical protein
MQLAYDGTYYMDNALKEITKTLAETIAIVGLVVFLFMGSIRSVLVPLVAMPVSLVGAAVFMLLMGFSLNLLTILAIVLAVGLVVDDAIVMVENVERHIREGKPKIAAALMAARRALRAVVSMTITLAAVDAAHRLPGRPHRRALPRVRLHARRRRRRLGHRRSHPLAHHERDAGGRLRTRRVARPRFVNHRFDGVRRL